MFNLLFHKVRDMVPESQAYMDLLSFEKRLDTTIARKRLEIQEAVKRPLKVIAICIVNYLMGHFISNGVNLGYLYPINFTMHLVIVRRRQDWYLTGSCVLKDDY